MIAKLALLACFVSGAVSIHAFVFVGNTALGIASVALAVAMLNAVYVQALIAVAHQHDDE